METLYHQTNQLIQETSYLFQKLEKDPADAEEVENAIQSIINAISACHRVLAHRLRSGHIPLNSFAFLMKKVNSPNCTECERVEDVYHVLMECVRIESERVQYVLQYTEYAEVGGCNSVLAFPTRERARQLLKIIKTCLHRRQNCEKMDIYVFKTPINQRPMAKMRVDQLKYDNKHIQASLTKVKSKRQRREQERSEREQLLSRRFTGSDHTEITVDYLSQEQNSLQYSHRNVDDMLSTGSNILDTLRYNRETLKGAHRRIIDLANTLGLSNATISLIERRVAQDKYVLFGGMFVTIAVITLVIIYMT